MVQGHTSSITPPPWLLRGNATVILYRRGVLAFLRYTESNVGPYDELLWLSPFRKGPSGRAHHVPVIFVSSAASAQSGRANWGLPKQLAEFQVTALPRGAEQIEIRRSGQPIASFLRSRPSAALPFDASRIPSWARRLVQHSEGRSFTTVPDAQGRFSPTRVSQLELNRDLLPDAQSSRWRLGMYLSHFELLFPAPEVTPGTA